MTVDASRSCLGLGTCVGSAIREIMDARVLLTATAPPAVPVRSVLDGSLAPPLDATTRFPRSACRHHMASDGPDEAGQFAGNHGGDDIGRLAGPRERLKAPRGLARASSARQSNLIIATIVQVVSDVNQRPARSERPYTKSERPYTKSERPYTKSERPYTKAVPHAKV